VASNRNLPVYFGRTRKEARPSAEPHLFKRWRVTVGNRTSSVYVAFGADLREMQRRFPTATDIEPLPDHGGDTR
jgi:hypothetical protein